MANRYPNHIKAFRDALGLTMGQLADELAVTRQTMISLEYGRKLPTFRTILRIEAYFGLRLREIYRVEEFADE